MIRRESVSSQLRDMALAPIECDVPDRWSLSDYRAAIALRDELDLPWWRQVRRSPPRSAAAAVARFGR